MKQVSRFGSLVVLPALALCPATASADYFTRTAKSGVTSRMFTYHAHGEDCRAAGGIIKVVTKPEHGKLVPSREMSTIKGARNRSTCIGATIPGFRVDYTSAPGYRGDDNFAIEYTFGSGGVVLDRFTVHVE
jgi:hypothetical protein